VLQQQRHHFPRAPKHRIAAYRPRTVFGSATPQPRAEDMLRELAFVYSLTRSITQAMTAEKTAPQAVTVRRPVRLASFPTSQGGGTMPAKWKIGSWGLTAAAGILIMATGALAQTGGEAPAPSFPGAPVPAAAPPPPAPALSSGAAPVAPAAATRGRLLRRGGADAAPRQRGRLLQRIRDRRQGGNN
jgi:hypothetical protein